MYDLQEAAGTAESQYVLRLADSFVNERLSDTDRVYRPGNNASVGDREFADLWNRVFAFREYSYLTEEEQVYLKQKLPAPVLTRWHTVGVAAQVVDRLYLHLLKATQIYINTYDTKSRPNKIAAGLQSLLAEPLLYSDLQLVKCFHKAFLQEHFEWLQACTDLSNLPGFQSHQVLARFFLMRKDLLYINKTIRTSHPKLECYRASLRNLEVKDKSIQETKVDIFFTESTEALIKHF